MNKNILCIVVCVLAILLMTVLDSRGQIGITGNAAFVGAAGFSAASGGAWLPSTVSGLKGWWKADAGTFTDAGSTACTSNSYVYQWNDQSGNGIDAIQTVLASRPTWYANYQNGLGVISDGGDRFFDISTLSISAGSKTFFAVLNLTSVAGSQWVFDSQTGRLAISPVSNAGSGSGGWYDGAWHEFTPVTTGWHTFIWVLTAGATSYMYLDGTQLGAGATYTSTAIGGTTALLGRYDGSSTIITGLIGEIGIYNSALGGTDRTSLQSYLKTKWATP